MKTARVMIVVLLMMTALFVGQTTIYADSPTSQETPACMVCIRPIRLAMPDLRVLAVTGFDGSMYSVTVSIENIGASAAGKTFWVQTMEEVQGGGASSSLQPIDDLAPGKSLVYHFNFPANACTKLTVDADSTQIVTEMKENNNKLVLNFCR